MNHTTDELDSLRAEVASLRAEVDSLRREEQPMPVVLPGAVPVLPLVHRTLGEMLTPRHPQMGAILTLLDERTAKGVATYKIALMAPNGRDFLKDATEEAADLVQYLAGLRHLRDQDPRRLRLLHALVSVAYNQTTLALAEAEMEFHP